MPFALASLLLLSWASKEGAIMAKVHWVIVSSLIALTAACGGRVDGEKHAPETSGQPQSLGSECVSATQSGGWIKRAVRAPSPPFTEGGALSTRAGAGRAAVAGSA